MKQYPSIQNSSKAPRDFCYAFYKYDGSNLRFTWQRKKGWCKFGTRRRLFDETDEVFGEAIPLFMEKVAPDIEPILKKKYRDARQFTVFCEFFGEESFAGQHKDDEKELRVIDVNVHKKGFIDPNTFVKLFLKEEFEDWAPELIYRGNLNTSFIEDVRNGVYDVNEGVVCKGGKGHDLWMCKIKTKKYLDKLKETYASGWENYWE